MKNPAPQRTKPQDVIMPTPIELAEFEEMGKELNRKKGRWGIVGGALILALLVLAMFPLRGMLEPLFSTPRNYNKLLFKIMLGGIIVFGVGISRYFRP